jgi:ABC-type proline/glycine betaine transport system permease subunit
MRVIFGEAHSSAEQLFLVRVVMLAMAPLGLTLVLVNFQVAQHRFKLIVPLVACALAYAVGVSIWHETLRQVVSVLAVVSVASAVALVLGVPWRSEEVAAKVEPAESGLRSLP